MKRKVKRDQVNVKCPASKSKRDQKFHREVEAGEREVLDDQNTELISKVLHERRATSQASRSNTLTPTQPPTCSVLFLAETSTEESQEEMTTTSCL